MEKKYLAIWDDGHDYGEFVFYSRHRANSKKNLEDAMNTYHKRYGYSHKIKITNVYLERGE